MSELRYLTKEERIGKIVISASGLIEMMKSPMHYHAKYILGDEAEESKAREDGTLLHMAYYEKDKFIDKYSVLDDKKDYFVTADDLKKRIEELGEKPKGKKDALIDQLLFLDRDAKIWDNYISETEKSGKKLLSNEDYKKVTRVIENINNHWWLSKLPEEGRQSEVAGYYTHESGIIISFRIDDLRFVKGKPVILDLKKTKNASPEAFSKEIWNWKLFIQAAIYSDAIKAITGVEPLYGWVAAEFSSPFCVECYAADFGMLEAGRAIYNKMIHKYLECLESDSWPSYGNGKVNEIALPHWTYNKLDEYAEAEIDAQ